MGTIGIRRLADLVSIFLFLEWNRKTETAKGNVDLALYRKLRSIIIQYNNCYNALPDHKDCLFIIHAFSQLVRDFYIYIF